MTIPHSPQIFWAAAFLSCEKCRPVRPLSKTAMPADTPPIHLEPDRKNSSPYSPLIDSNVLLRHAWTNRVKHPVALTDSPSPTSILACFHGSTLFRDFNDAVVPF